ncbi:Recyclin-1 [Hypsizygus marmoreus]|uniref:Recyclin-1 n=1 Tax=Hypsizygus marmoreus TaxID=39966 RepID=A0A369KDE4_HYPMA|nr:Recyclin-1 [Hypsizygus marmoreus]
MDKFATLEPVRLYASSAATTGARLLSLGHTHKPTPLPAQRIGRLPADLHQLILSHVPIPDIPAYSRASRALNSLAKDEKLWERRWQALGIEKYSLGPVLDELESVQQNLASAARASVPPTLAVSNDDDFGDFAAVEQDVSVISSELGDFVGSPHKATGFNFLAAVPASKKHLYIRAHNLLKPVTSALASNPPHLVLSALSTFFSSPNNRGSTSPSLRTRSKALHLLALFLSPQIQPLRAWSSLAASLRAAMDRFDANMLAAFDNADGRGDEDAMRDAAGASWEVWEAGAGALASPADWEMGKVWAEKREIFYDQGNWNPLDNFTADGSLDFDAMDEFMTFVLKAIEEHGSRAVRVFPPPSQVLISFADRIANDVVGEYITTLLTRARSEASGATFLQATAASFKEAWRMVDAIMKAAQERPDAGVQRHRAEDVVYQMFESNMDEYLDEEVESVKHAFDAICQAWDRELSTTNPYIPNPNSASSTQPTHQHAQQPRFLSSHNPAQVKRNVLASFTSVLLLPVTIVPRTVGAVGEALMTGGSAAVQGIAMLNPVRWGGGAAVRPSRGGVSKDGWGVGGGGGGGSVYRGADEKEGSTLFEVGQDEDEEDEKEKGSGEWNDRGNGEVGGGEDPWAQRERSRKPTSVSTTRSHTATSSRSSLAPSTLTTSSTAATSTTSPNTTAEANKLELLLSLDVALEVIHADREALKRVETFAGYPGHYGHRVRDTIEELFILMLGALGEEHLRKGFGRATEQMLEYKPAEHEVTTSVAPLMQFFELVHVGDTIQSMVQVYFDKELAHHIDRTDFLNPVVREKKRFENALDDSVAGGLNAGTEVLMNQVEHIILTLTKPREYYPPEDGPLELGATKGCTEAIRCLEMHCKLLKGSTSKEVLEVFYQEVGIRLIAILQKHIKRQIISLNGGFQVIADLNTYHGFISSLKVPAITLDFAHLKMLGHVYVVEDAKDLAQIVRDVTRYGGAYRPEDIYEFIQRRSDWKKIEKTVDKTMYNLSFKEDCVVC